MKTIRWGIIGCGDVTEVKSGPGLQKAAHSSLVSVMRRNGALAADYAKRHGVPKWTDDADRVINDPEVDIVYIATPPSSHLEYTLRVAAAKKPVYVEKPMARNHDECRRMVEACRTAGVPLFVAFYRRGLPRFLKVKELIDSGAIGRVRFVTVTQFQRPFASLASGAALPWRLQPEISGGGLFIDLASHTLDILDFLLGPIASATGHASNQAGLYTAEDIVTGSWQFASGVQGTGTWCFTAYASCDQNRIIGDRGEIAFSTFGGDPITLTTPEGSETFPGENPLHIQQPLIQTIVDELNGTGKCPSTGESAARTNRIMDQLLENYRTGLQQ